MWIKEKDTQEIAEAGLEKCETCLIYCMNYKTEEIWND